MDFVNHGMQSLLISRKSDSFKKNNKSKDSFLLTLVSHLAHKNNQDLLLYLKNNVKDYLFDEAIKKENDSLGFVLRSDGTYGWRFFSAIDRMLRSKSNESESVFNFIDQNFQIYIKPVHIHAASDFFRKMYSHFIQVEKSVDATGCSSLASSREATFENGKKRPAETKSESSTAKKLLTKNSGAASSVTTTQQLKIKLQSNTNACIGSADLNVKNAIEELASMESQAIRRAINVSMLLSAHEDKIIQSQAAPASYLLFLKVARYLLALNLFVAIRLYARKDPLKNVFLYDMINKELQLAPKWQYELSLCLSQCSSDKNMFFSREIDENESVGSRRFHSFISGGKELVQIFDTTRLEERSEDITSSYVYCRLYSAGQDAMKNRHKGHPFPWIIQVASKLNQLRDKSS